jgi:phage protein U
MIFSFGEFKFTIETNINKFSRSIDTGVSFTDRIRNHAAPVVTKRWKETINIDGKTIPAAGAGQKALEPLIKIVKAQKAEPLTSGTGEFLGNYIATNFTEGREKFFPTGEFLAQEFSLELRRVGT